MTPEQFCYWLQGRAELQPGKVPTAAEWKMIREHLQTVFVKVTPPLQIDTTPRSPSSAPNVWPWTTTIRSPNTTNAIPIAIC